jgi:hypothetical protein
MGESLLKTDTTVINNTTLIEITTLVHVTLLLLLFYFSTLLQLFVLLLLILHCFNTVEVSGNDSSFIVYSFIEQVHVYSVYTLMLYKLTVSITDV